MNYHSLREFIDRLEFENELVRIKRQVSPILEIAEITDRESKRPHGGRALLFENVEGSSMPVLINAFGSFKRMNAALGVSDMEEVAREMERYLKISPPQSLTDKIKLLPMLLQASNFPPKLVSNKKALCQEVVHTGDDVDLFQIPVLQCWPDDAGRFITFPMVINRDYEHRVRNVGLYRMQVFDKKTTGMHWHIHKDGAHFFHEYQRQNKIMEVAVALGGDPASCYSASAPLPYGVDEFLLAGFLRKAPVEMVKCKTVDLEVPATAEIVLEGFIDPAERRLEGPFGDHTGYYSQDGDYPVFHVTAITHRKDPIYLTTIVGKPPQEDYYLGHATERIFLPLLRMQLPELVDMHMPVEGVFHNCVIASIDKRYPMQARRLMSAFWGLGQMSFVKSIIVVDREVDVANTESVLKILLNEVDFDKDLFFAEGILDVLNHASEQALFGSKLGIDATQKLQGEPGFGATAPTIPTPPPADLDRKVTQQYDLVTNCRMFQPENRSPVLLIALDKTSAGESQKFMEEFFHDSAYDSIAVLVLLESHVDLSNNSELMWKFFNNLDPKRDIRIQNGRLGFDATRKYPEENYHQRWPDEIEMSPEIKIHVDKHWQDYFA